MFKKIGIGLLIFIASSASAFGPQADYVIDTLMSIKVNHYLQMDFYLLNDTVALIGPDDMPEPMDGLVRTPSNYGLLEIDPSNQHLYQVVDIENHIPNQKGLLFKSKITVDKDGRRSVEFIGDEEQAKKYKRGRVLRLRRINLAQKDTEGIFWYINAESGKLEIFEGGDELGTITDIRTWEALPANL